jgi:hypothetical protein
MITINLDKAKDISHNIRREKRAEEFKPYDEIIMKQIPGNNTTEAETARVVIREKYAVIQQEIDNADNADNLLSIVKSFS